MSEKRVKSSDSRKMRQLTENTSLQSHRDYLEMDTDEEDFGQQETPEPITESPLEPEKPNYTKEDLQTLVQQVKNLTVLPSIDECILSPECTEVIEEFFSHPGHSILTIFYDKTKKQCQTSLNFPPKTTRTFTYFARRPWQIYTPSNFMSTIIFGSCSEMENSVLKFMSTLYTSFAMSSNQWPKVTKPEVFSSLNKFLLSLTEVTYQPLGLTMLYTPRIEEKISESRDNGLIERLERVAGYWVKQIRAVLNEINVTPESACRTILDEIKLWNYKFDNLSCLDYQLSSNCIKKITDILKKFQSKTIEKIDALKIEITKFLLKIKSIITYLNIFIDYCKDFEIPHGIDDYVTKILLLIRYIAIESEFFSTLQQIETLCRALGSDIIAQCKKHIDLNVILEGDPTAGKKMLSNSIKCCERLLKIFNEITLMEKSLKERTISCTNTSHIFYHVDTFVQRCHDLMEISDARILFDTGDDLKIINGDRSLNHEDYYKEIKNKFIETLDKIKKCHGCILDVTVFDWPEKMQKFRLQIEEINNMVIQLIRNIFHDVDNVEDGIEVLYTLKRFMAQKCLHKTLITYWKFIWQLFTKEREFSITNRIDNTDYITSQFTMLLNASDWLDLALPNR